MLTEENVDLPKMEEGIVATQFVLLLNVHGGEKAYQGRGRVGKGGQKSETSNQAPTWKTEAAVDRRQNNRMLRQCPSGIAQQPPHHAIAVSTAMQNKHNVRSSAAGKQLKQKKSNSQAQLHLPALDLFWANFFVSPAHLPPLDLAWTLLS